MTNSSIITGYWLVWNNSSKEKSTNCISGKCQDKVDIMLAKCEDIIGCVEDDAWRVNLCH